MVNNFYILSHLGSSFMSDDVVSFSFQEKQERWKAAASTEAIIIPRDEEKQHPSSKEKESDDEEEIRAMMKNGGIGGDGAFKWSQTISNLYLTFTLPQALHSSNIKVVLHRQTVHVSCYIDSTQEQQRAPSAGGREVIEVINGRLSRPICVDESTWMLEK